VSVSCNVTKDAYSRHYQRRAPMWCRMYEAAVFQIILKVGQAVPIVGRRFLMQGLGPVCWTLIDLVCLANTSKAPERSIPVLKFSVFRGMTRIRRLISISARPGTPESTQDCR
jgi:hypothetical protein